MSLYVMYGCHDISFTEWTRCTARLRPASYLRSLGGATSRHNSDQQWVTRSEQ